MCRGVSSWPFGAAALLQQELSQVARAAPTCKGHRWGPAVGSPRWAGRGVSVGFWVPGDFLGIFLVFG